MGCWQAAAVVFTAYAGVHWLSHRLCKEVQGLRVQNAFTVCVCIIVMLWRCFAAISVAVERAEHGEWGDCHRDEE
jgi:hypothetical protein